MDQYLIFSDIILFSRMRTSGSQLQVCDLLGNDDTAVADWEECSNHCGGCSATDCHCPREETDSPFVQCHKELQYDVQPV